MRVLALSFILILSAAAQGRQNPFWTIVGRGSSIPASCNNNTIFIYSTDGSYRYCIAGAFHNPFLAFSGTYTGLQDFSGATWKIPSSAGFTATSSSMFGYDTTNHNFHGFLNNADAVLAGFASTPTNGHCVQVSVSGSNVLLGDFGAACGGSGGTPGGSDQAVQINNAGSFGADTANFQYVTSTSSPSAPAVATHGTAGSTTYGYRVTYQLPTGESAASSETLITTGNAVLDATNYNVITPSACSGTTNTTVNIYVSTTGGNITSYGWVGNTPCGTAFDHTGQNGDSNNLSPSQDFSKGLAPINAVTQCTPPGLLNELSKFWNGGPGTNSFAEGDGAGDGMVAVGQYLNLFANNSAFGCTAPTAVPNGAVLGGIYATGFDGNTWVSSAAQVQGIVDGSPSAGNLPVGWKFITGSTGSGGKQTALFLHANGTVDLGGGSNILYRCSVAGTLRVGQLTTVSGDCGTAVDTGLRVQ